jgi:hypothetical protein
MLDLLEANQVIASFPITPGSKNLPAPIGTWQVVKVTTMPVFRWDEAMLKHGRRSGNFYTIPPGPRNPVGIVWIGLNKKGIGIHGTDSPDTIGRSASHGCIRLVFARFFGRVMPIWMAVTLLLHLLLLWLTWRWPADHTVFLVLAIILWIIVIVFSVIGPVPINDRVKTWDISSLPEDWKAQRRRWDTLNAIRVFLIGFAFVALLLSFKAFP